MFDTMVTIVGNALNAPEWRRTANGNVVVSFKIASTARRFNRLTGEWADGNHFRIRVTCWRRLAEGVGQSVRVGDPLVVLGRLFTREWTDEQLNRRVSYELEAVAIGHDLSKGEARFSRFKPPGSTSMVEDAATDERIGGELATPLAASEIPVPPPDGSERDDLDDDTWARSTVDPYAVLREAGLAPVPLGETEIGSGHANGSGYSGRFPVGPIDSDATLVGAGGDAARGVLGGVTAGHPTRPGGIGAGQPDDATGFSDGTDGAIGADDGSDDGDGTDEGDDNGPPTDPVPVSEPPPGESTDGEPDAQPRHRRNRNRVPQPA